MIDQKCSCLQLRVSRDEVSSAKMLCRSTLPVPLDDVPADAGVVVRIDEVGSPDVPLSARRTLLYNGAQSHCTI